MDRGAASETALAAARGLYCLSEHSGAHGDPSLGVQDASEIIALEPFRETGYQQLMRVHARASNRAEALRVFGRCRELLREELGTVPPLRPKPSTRDPEGVANHPETRR